MPAFAAAQLFIVQVVVPEWQQYLSSLKVLKLFEQLNGRLKEGGKGEKEAG